MRLGGGSYGLEEFEVLGVISVGEVYPQNVSASNNKLSYGLDRTTGRSDSNHYFGFYHRGGLSGEKEITGRSVLWAGLVIWLELGGLSLS